MGIIAFIILGLIAGAIAKALMPGDDPGGWIVTALIGIVGARAFGQTGPHSPRPGFGTLAEAYAGFAYINGDPDRPPILPAFGLADSTTGLMGAYLVMVALAGRAANGGKGQQIDLAIYEPLFTLLGPQAINFDQLGIVQERTGSRHSFTSPRNCYRTKDGKYVAHATFAAPGTYVLRARADDGALAVDEELTVTVTR